jgi:hypothetical protein
LSICLGTTKRHRCRASAFLKPHRQLSWGSTAKHWEADDARVEGAERRVQLRRPTAHSGVGRRSGSFLTPPKVKATTATICSAPSLSSRLSWAKMQVKSHTRNSCGTIVNLSDLKIVVFSQAPSCRRCLSPDIIRTWFYFQVDHAVFCGIICDQVLK